MTMAMAAQHQHQDLHRPSSPTELSYTQLVKLAPPISLRRQNNVSGGAGAGSSSNLRLRTPAAAAGALASDPALPMPDASRTAPPASISVPTMCNPNVRMERNGVIDGVGVAKKTDATTNDGLHIIQGSHQHQHQTPAYTSKSSTSSIPLSAPLRYATRPIMISQQQVRSQNDYLGSYSVNMSTQHTLTPMDARVSSLAMKLQTMQPTPVTTSGHFNAFLPTLHHSQQHQHQQRPNEHPNEIQQFIDTLKNMQEVVSHTADEQQRVKKSRALNALLSMFERIIEDRSHTMMTREITDVVDPTLKLSIKELEQRVQQLEDENQHMQLLCQQMNDELQYSQCELQRLATTNEQLKNDVMQVQEQCHQEVKRALEAESVATEAENVRDGLLANYARLSEANVDLQREVENVKLENNKMVTEFEFCQQEMPHLQEQCGELSLQLQRKGLDVVELEKTIADLNDQLAAQRNVLQSTNADRQRLQDELHNSQRNSTTASEQLMKLRDQFSQVRRENDSKRHQQLTQESEFNIVLNKLQEEQQRRRELERSMVHQLPTSSSSRCEDENDMVATEELRRIASANAVLKKKVDGLNAQSDSSIRPEIGKSTIERVSMDGTNSATIR
ncbi:hypothetical protein ACHAWU_003466 [Discostella pseudostelligera]|uniref:Uncharacterized protein n=1 Tax=Discostella pseudostelligera TaxID=259834 RepID=A0ABD3LXB6_9STRA